MCTGFFVSDLAQFAEIPMIFYHKNTHISWVVLEYSATFGPNCSIFCDMAAILKFKNHTFAHFSQSILDIRTKLGRDIAGVKGTLSVNFTSNDLDLRKLWPFLGSKITFLHFSPNLL